MKRKKYGEETCVIRVPGSRKYEVLKFLESFEVIGTLSAGDSIREAYIKGFNDCFNEWENYNQALPLILSGNSDSVPLLMDTLNGRLPDSAHGAAFDKLGDVLLKSDKAVCKLAIDYPMLESLLEQARTKVRTYITDDTTKSLSNTKQLPSLGGLGLDLDTETKQALSLSVAAKPRMIEFLVKDKENDLTIAWVRAFSHDDFMSFKCHMGWIYLDYTGLIRDDDDYPYDDIDVIKSDFKGIDAYQLFKHDSDVSVSISIPAYALRTVDRKAKRRGVGRDVEIARILSSLL